MEFPSGKQKSSMWHGDCLIACPPKLGESSVYPSISLKRLLFPVFLIALSILTLPAGGLAQDGASQKHLTDFEAYVTNQPVDSSSPLAPFPGPGHNAWLMISAALVLFMTAPGLALFYGGLVRSKNVLSVIAQCYFAAGVIGLLWWFCGYSLIFGKGFQSPFLGGLEHLFFNGVTSAPNHDYSPWVSENIFAMFQLMFAIITPLLIFGATAERMKFSAVIGFIILWMFVVYFPTVHMAWGSTGFMNGIGNPDARIKAIDFAGAVIHITSGWTALTLCLILGKRVGYSHENMMPHSTVLCAVGTGMLWFGWYGFNAGSAQAADSIAAHAFVATTFSATTATLVWGMWEMWVRGKISVVGLCSGTVAGLVVVTPACGFLSPTSAVIIGALGGSACFLACAKLKAILGYDDSLDTFGVHGVGGTLGALLGGFFASATINPNLNTNLHDYVGKTLWLEQLKAIVLTIIIAVVATIAIAYIVKCATGLRLSEDKEREGLDLNEHGEEGYHV